MSAAADELDQEQGGDELEGFTPPEVPRRGPGRPKGSKNRAKSPEAEGPSSSSSPGFSTSRLRDKLREPILKVAEWLEGRDPEFAQALQEDAAKIANLLTKWASSPKCPPGVVAAIRFVAVMLEPIDAFGRVARLSYIRLRDRAIARRAARELELAPEGFVPFAGGVEPEGEQELEGESATLTPDRFRADREPPPVE